MVTSYKNDASEVGFLVGGIGTGTYSVGARGEIKDFEWFNRPGKGNQIPYTFFSMWLKEKDREPVVKVLEAKLNPPYSRSHGYAVGACANLPRFSSSTFTGAYPFATIRLEDAQIPLEITMETFNPFIPLDTKNSGIPGGIIRYAIKNTTACQMEVSVCGSITNVAGVREFERHTWENLTYEDTGVSEYKDDTIIRGLYYSCNKLHQRSLYNGNLCLITGDRHEDVTCKSIWLNRGNWDGLTDFWSDFREDGKLEEKSTYAAVNPGEVREMKTGSLCINKVLQPGECYTYEFILSWYYPNRQDNWEYDYCECGHCETHSIRNYYAGVYENAWSAARYLYDNKVSLEARTRSFTNALYESTLPQSVIESVANNITTIRSTICFRIEDGTFLGWEGGFRTEGCCEGSCTHVWNYAQTLAFLFPELEKTMRRVEFKMETDSKGKMAFRTRKVFGKEGWEYHPAADGQMGCIIRLYRDYMLTGDKAYLKELWPDAKRALAYTMNYLDSNKDYVLDAQQHNTYDIEFYGENSLTNSMFFTALKCAARIESELGDLKEAKRYETILAKGTATMDEMLWNGEYYIQKTDNVDQYLYQYGTGCLSDQVFGQLLGMVNGLGYTLPEEHVKSAVHAIYRYNFIHDFTSYEGTQRTYALNDEKGLVLCTWPNGGKPKLPFIYSDEVWAGVEYQVGAHLIYEGYLEEGLELVEAVRKRYDGYRRNPFCEVECGNHYVRSMASYLLLLALTEFKYDMRKNQVSFCPKYNRERFQCFFSTGKAWGILKQTIDEKGKIQQDIEVIEGEKITLG